MKITGRTIVFLTLALAGCSASSQPEAPKPSPAKVSGSVTARQVIERYAEHVYRAYVAAEEGAEKLQQAVEAFVANPGEATLATAKGAWIEARGPYGRTEAFRFYEGPIDAPAGKGREEGPEGRLNAWPLNEAYIDYVQGDAKAGIIQQGLIPITVVSLKQKNAKDDEKDVTTGYHAIEFLLWGQDLNAEGPGQRPLSDYVGKNPTTQRRREYLQAAMKILVGDLRSLVEQWKPGAENYRAGFVKMEEKEAIGKILTGLATLSGFELASERIATALDSGQQEDEQSCFSDNTHNDYLDNLRGLADVYEKTGLNVLVSQTDAGVNGQIEANQKAAWAAAWAVPPPLDRILASPKGSEGRQKLERLVALLQEQSKLLQQAGKAMGVEVVIVAQ